MKTSAVISELCRLGIEISLVGENLKLRGEQSALEVAAPLVRENKDGLIAALRLEGGDDWRCPIGHGQSWSSHCGVRVCAVCHPKPEVLTWQ